MMQAIIDVFDYLVLEINDAAVVAPPNFAREIRLVESQYLDMSGKPGKLVVDDPVRATRRKYFYRNDNCCDLVSICLGQQFLGFVVHVFVCNSKCFNCSGRKASFKSAR